MRTRIPYAATANVPNEVPLQLVLHTASTLPSDAIGHPRRVLSSCNSSGGSHTTIGSSPTSTMSPTTTAARNYTSGMAGPYNRAIGPYDRRAPDPITARRCHARKELVFQRTHLRCFRDRSRRGSGDGVWSWRLRRTNKICLQGFDEALAPPHLRRNLACVLHCVSWRRDPRNFFNKVVEHVERGLRDVEVSHLCRYTLSIY
jgi:hypothetical protein